MSASGYIDMPTAAALVGRHVASVTRWARFGLRGIKLESRLFGNRLVTTREWVDKFGAELAQAQAPPSRAAPEPAARPRTSRRRVRDMAQAEQVCARFGL